MVFLEVWWEAWGSFRVTVGTSGSLVYCLWEVRTLFMIRGASWGSLGGAEWNRASFCVEGGMSWFFSSYGSKLGVPLELRLASQGTSSIILGKSSLRSWCEGEQRIAIESLQGNQASSRIKGGISWCFSC